jgi:hypothetical protein
MTEDLTPEERAALMSLVHQAAGGPSAPIIINHRLAALIRRALARIDRLDADLAKSEGKVTRLRARVAELGQALKAREESK